MLQSMWLQKVRYDLVPEQQQHMHKRVGKDAIQGCYCYLNYEDLNFSLTFLLLQFL